MNEFSIPQETNLIPGFGSFAPSPWRQSVIRFTRSMPEGWWGRRMAFAARRLAFVPKDIPLDIEIDGVRFRLIRQGNLCEKRLMFTPQYFDAAELEIIRQDVAATKGQRPYVFLDIGANIGAYSLFVASWAGPEARVFAFEPQPHIFRRLAANLSFNAYATVTPLQMALADSNEPVMLHIDRINSGESSLKKLDTMTTTTAVEVPARTLMAFAAENGLSHISGMKLDVEGAEDLILSPFFREAPDSLLAPLMIVENAAERWQRDIVAEARARGYSIEQTTSMNLVMRR